MKINILQKDRYSFELKLNQRRNTGLKGVSTETLRTLWLAKYNERAVPMQQIYAESAEDFADVAQELFDRKQVRYEELYSADTFETKRFFVLEKEHADH
jgi:hypothetical protein